MPQRKLQKSFRNIAKKFFLIILVVLLILLVLGVMFAPLLIRINKIECVSQYGECGQEMSFELNGFAGNSLSKVKKEIKSYLNAKRQVDNFSLQFELINTLRVDVIIKKPVSCVSGSSGFLLLSYSGEILSESDKCSLPKVVGVGIDKKAGETIDGVHMTSSKIMQGIYKMYQVTDGVLSESGLTVELEPGLAVIFPKEEGDPSELLGALRLIYTKIKSEGREFREIDLRFENPVLR